MVRFIVCLLLVGLLPSPSLAQVHAGPYDPWMSPVDVGPPETSNAILACLIFGVVCGLCGWGLAKLDANGECPGLLVFAGLFWLICIAFVAIGGYALYQKL